MKGRELIEELVQIRAAFDERIDRLISELRGEGSGPNLPPALPRKIVYDETRLAEPPLVVEPEGYHRERDEAGRPPREEGPDCDCGLPAKLIRGNKNGKPWAGYFCAKDRTHPQNCGYRKWV